jgi:hypothetical protein
MANITVVALIKEAVCEVKARLAPNNVEMICARSGSSGSRRRLSAFGKLSYACTIFNLDTVQTPEGIEHSAVAFPQTHRQGSDG